MSWQELHGWFSFQNAYDTMVEVARDGDVIVEVGVAFGRSLAYVSRQLIDRRLDGVRLIGVDPWKDDWDTPHPTWGAEHRFWAREQGGPFNAFLAGMREHARVELERCDVWRMKSLEAAHLVPLSSCAGVLIDGDHGYEACKADIAAWLPRVKLGGLLAGDDYASNFPGVMRAVREAFGESFEVVGTTWRKHL